MEAIANSTVIILLAKIRRLDLLNIFKIIITTKVEEEILGSKKVISENKYLEEYVKEKIRIEDPIGKGKLRSGVSFADNLDGYLIAYGNDSLMLSEALQKASLEYLGTSSRDFPYFVRHEPEDKLDGWILKGNKLWIEKNKNKGVTIEARDSSYQCIFSVVQDSFEKAYDSLCELVR